MLRLLTPLGVLPRVQSCDRFAIESQELPVSQSGLLVNQNQLRECEED